MQTHLFPGVRNQGVGQAAFPDLESSPNLGILCQRRMNLALQNWPSLGPGTSS